MAPTYKDLAKSWLSNWLSCVCVRNVLRKSVSPACACVCVSRVYARRNRGFVQVEGGTKPCFDRYTLDAVTHSRKINAESRGRCRFATSSAFSNRTSAPDRRIVNLPVTGGEI